MRTSAAFSTGLEGEPRLARLVERYGSCSPENAHYVVIGTLRVGQRLTGGLLAFADNEFHAHLLCRELGGFAESRYGGVGVKRTASHPDGATFDVGEWRRRVGLVVEAATDVVQLAVEQG